MSCLSIQCVNDLCDSALISGVNPDFCTELASGPQGLRESSAPGL